MNAQQPSKPVDKPDLKLLVVDRATRKPVLQAELRIYSDNGIRCIRPPCNTNGMEWKGTTDKRGYVVIPNRIRQNSMTLTAVGYSHGWELNRESRKRSKNFWVISIQADRPRK